MMCALYLGSQTYKVHLIEEASLKYSLPQTSFKTLMCIHKAYLNFYKIIIPQARQAVYMYHQLDTSVYNFQQ